MDSIVVLKICVDCGKEKALHDHFYKSSVNKGGYATHCKECARLRNDRAKQLRSAECVEAQQLLKQEYRQRPENKLRATEQRREARIHWTEEQWAEFRRKRTAGKLKHREQRYSSPVRHSEAQWLALLAACGYKCVKCGCGDSIIGRDHVIPLSLGGSDAIDNIQPLCLECNSAKNNQSTDYRQGHEVTAARAASERMLTCPRCAASFTTTNKRKRFCNMQCMRRFYSERSVAKKKASR